MIKKFDNEDPIIIFLGLFLIIIFAIFSKLIVNPHPLGRGYKIK